MFNKVRSAPLYPKLDLRKNKEKEKLNQRADDKKFSQLKETINKQINEKDNFKTSFPRRKSSQNESNLMISGYSSFCRSNVNFNFPATQEQKSKANINLNEILNNNQLNLQEKENNSINGSFLKINSFHSKQKQSQTFHEQTFIDSRENLNSERPSVNPELAKTCLFTSKFSQDLTNRFSKRKDPLERLNKVYGKKEISNAITKKKKIESKTLSDFSCSEKPILKNVEPKEGIKVAEIKKISNDHKIDGLKESFVNPWNIPFSNLFDNLLIENFKLKETLGKGGYGIVRLATGKLDCIQYAIKTYEKYKLTTDSQKMNNVRREIIILKKMNHKNIIKLHAAFEDSRQIHLVMEYVGSQSLLNFLKFQKGRRLTEENAKIIFKQLASALSYCHSQSIVHRDIKLDNILLENESNIKLIDFGFSIVNANQKKLNVFCGTPSYMAPEILTRNYNGYSADVWALGIVLYVMLCGHFPFKGINENDLFKKINKGEFFIPEFLSEDAGNLLKSILTVKWTDRLKADQILESKWFNEMEEEE